MLITASTIPKFHIHIFILCFVIVVFFSLFIARLLCEFVAWLQFFSIVLLKRYSFVFFPALLIYNRLSLYTKKNVFFCLLQFCCVFLPVVGCCHLVALVFVRPFSHCSFNTVCQPSIFYTRNHIWGFLILQLCVNISYDRCKVTQYSYICYNFTLNFLFLLFSLSIQWCVVFGFLILVV